MRPCACPCHRRAARADATGLIRRRAIPAARLASLRSAQPPQGPARAGTVGMLRGVTALWRGVVHRTPSCTVAPSRWPRWVAGTALTGAAFSGCSLGAGWVVRADGAAAESVPPFNPAASRFDQSTFGGRLQQIIAQLDPMKLLVSKGVCTYVHAAVPLLCTHPPVNRH